MRPSGRSPAMQAAWPRNGTTRYRREQRGAERRAGELVDGDEARHEPGVADAEIALGDDHRQQVEAVVSANVSAVPRRNMATRTTAMLTRSSDDRGAERRGGSPPAPGVRRSMIRRRSSRSAATPASRPKNSHGTRCSTTASATRNGSRVWEATSSGPAARAMPSPRLLTHDDPSSQRNETPSRDGATASSTRVEGGLTSTARPRTRPNGAGIRHEGSRYRTVIELPPLRWS